MKSNYYSVQYYNQKTLHSSYFSQILFLYFFKQILGIFTVEPEYNTLHLGFKLDLYVAQQDIKNVKWIQTTELLVFLHRLRSWNEGKTL